MSLLNVAGFVMLHAALRAVSLPGSWWEALLLEPQLLAQGYVPTMGADEMAGILAGMREYVAWYKCPKGHIYTVGNCTRPMELAKCPTCGAPIGGQNHDDVRGVVRVGTTDEMRDIARSAADRGLKGYRRDDLNRVELDPNMNKFANLWPDELSGAEPLRDLGYRPQVDLAGMVQRVLGAHDERNMTAAQAFKAIDTCGAGVLRRSTIETYVRKYLVQGREDYSETGQQQVEGFIDRLMEQLNASGDGEVSWAAFSEWNRNNSIEAEIWKQVATVEDELRKQIREMGMTPRI